MRFIHIHLFGWWSYRVAIGIDMNLANATTETGEWLVMLTYD